MEFHHRTPFWTLTGRQRDAASVDFLLLLEELKRKWGLLATAEFLLLFRALTIFGAGVLIEGRVIYWGFVLLAGKGREGDR